MDTTDPDIQFDAQGVCNHCRRHDARMSAVPFRQPDAEARLQGIAARIKASKRGKYDSIMGLSGGVDSSYVALLAKRLGLNPLAIHFDNGWNSELAVKNIEHIVRKLDIDLETYVIDWEEFRDLQRSFFKANVIDIELVTDQAIFACMYRLAASHGIRYILAGSNVATESVMPRKWLHMKWDLRNMRAIHKRFGTLPLKSFPTLSIWKMGYFRYLRGIQTIDLLNYVPYDKTHTMQTLERELGWKYYGGKHYESQFTKFYQAHILPVKFNVDKRRCHFSNLILNGEISRDQALEALHAPLYDPNDLERDKSYVLKKLGFSRAEFDEYLAAPPVSHDHYPSHARIAERLLELRRSLGS
jgi:N-acetyl sugar amidotransferase